MPENAPFSFILISRNKEREVFSMITNLWGRLDLYCNNGHENKMELKEKRAGLFYECPCCQNSFSMKNIEKMLDKIDTIVNEAEKDDEILDIKNLSFKVGDCNYKILENGERMKVVGLNRKAIEYKK